MQSLQTPVKGTATCQHTLLQHTASSCSFRNRLHRHSRQRVDQNKRPCKCRNSTGDSSNGTSDSKNAAQQESGRIASTLAGLDLLLGVQPEKEEEDKASSQVCCCTSVLPDSHSHVHKVMSHTVTSCMQSTEAGPKVEVDISPEVLKNIAQADLGRIAATNGKKDSQDNKTAEKQLSDQMVSRS